jgi:hexokinase
VNRDPFENLNETAGLFQNKLSLACTQPELELIRRTAELIGIRAAGLSALAICKKKRLRDLPHRRRRIWLQQISSLQSPWCCRSERDLGLIDKDPIENLPAENGSGVSAALIAALTLKRGNMAGIKHPENYI